MAVGIFFAGGSEFFHALKFMPTCSLLNRSLIEWIRSFVSLNPPFLLILTAIFVLAWELSHLQAGLFGNYTLQGRRL